MISFARRAPLPLRTDEMERRAAPLLRISRVEPRQETLNPARATAAPRSDERVPRAAAAGAPAEQHDDEMIPVPIIFLCGDALKTFRSIGRVRSPQTSLRENADASREARCGERGQCDARRRADACRTSAEEDGEENESARARGSMLCKRCHFFRHKFSTPAPRPPPARAGRCPPRRYR